MVAQKNFMLSNDEYLKAFGIVGGMAVVRFIDVRRVLEMEVDRFKLFFQPCNATRARGFGLETIVNGNYRKGFATIRDIIDLTELSMSISSLQFRSSISSKKYVDEMKKNFKPQSERGDVFLNILIDMFENNEIEVSISHPKHFRQMFVIEEGDTDLYVFKRVLSSLELIPKIYRVSLSLKDHTKMDWFQSLFFPSVVRCLRASNGKGKKIRAGKELNKHRAWIEENEYYSFTEEEKTVLFAIIEKVIEMVKE